jgi:hypothetical protein
VSSDKKYGATDYQIQGIYVEELVIPRKVHECPEASCNPRTYGRRKRYRPCRRCHTPGGINAAQTDKRGGSKLIEALLIGWLGLGVRRKSEIEQMFQPFEFAVFRLLILFCFFTTAFPFSAAAP